MTEEQRYMERISEALDIIAAPHIQQKYKVDMSEVSRVYKKEKFDKDDIVDPFKLPD